MRRTIPKVRDHLLQIADDDRIPIGLRRQIKRCVTDLYRRTHAKRAKRRSVPNSPALQKEIRRLRKAHPDWSHQQIANKVKVNPGRISEVLYGKRK